MSSTAFLDSAIVSNTEKETLLRELANESAANSTPKLRPTSSSTVAANIRSPRLSGLLTEERQCEQSATVGHRLSAFLADVRLPVLRRR